MTEVLTARWCATIAAAAAAGGSRSGGGGHVYVRNYSYVPTATYGDWILARVLRG
jgi:hypothetical protein